MPSNILQADVGFPELTEEQTTDEKFQLVTNYLFMLREQLRYSLSNLDANNFSTGGIEGLTKLITEPIYAQLKDEDGNFAAITAMADGLGVRIGNAEGQLTQLTATVDGLNTTVNDPNTGLVSQVTQNAARIGWVIKGNSTQSTVSLTDAMFSAIAGGIAFTASNNASNTTTTLKLSANGAQIASPTISLSGLVAFTDLSTSGSTTINGANITTGSIAAARINTVGLSCQYLRASGNDTGNYAYVDSSGFYLIKGGTTKATLSAVSDNEVSWELGNKSGYNLLLKKYYESANKAWIGDDDEDNGINMNFNAGTIWMSAQPTYGSDRRFKEDIREDLERYETFFSALRPSTFLMINDKVAKRHCGFIAQDLQDALHDSDLEDEDFAGLSVPGMGDEYYGLAYGEFIGLLTHMIQKQAGEIEALEARIAALEAN